MLAFRIRMLALIIIGSRLVAVELVVVLVVPFSVLLLMLTEFLLIFFIMLLIFSVLLLVFLLDFSNQIVPALSDIVGALLTNKQIGYSSKGRVKFIP